MFVISKRHEICDRWEASMLLNKYKTNIYLFIIICECVRERERERESEYEKIWYSEDKSISCLIICLFKPSSGHLNM